MNETLKRLVAIKSHPKYFLKYGVFTKDGNSLDNPCRPFPYQLEYHQQICEEWYNNNLTIIEKSRQMQITWLSLSLFLWLALTGPDREIYFRRQTFDDALKLLDDTRYIYDHIPEHIWPRELLPRIAPKEGMLTFPDINTTMYAISSGRDKMRGRTPTGLLLDEFAFQEDAEMVYQTIRPSLMGQSKIMIVSTPKPLFGAEDPMFRRLHQDRA